MIRDNLKTAGLFAVGVTLFVVADEYCIGWYLFEPMGCVAMLSVASVLVVIGKTHDADSTLTRVVVAVGAVWVGLAWAIVPMTRSRYGLNVLASALLLAPAYLLVGIRRGHGIPFRIFVALAMVAPILPDLTPSWRSYFGILHLPSVHIGSGICIYLRNGVIFLPFLVAFTVKFILWWRKPRILPGHCATCAYDLTGNESGVCPECGSGIVSA